MSKQQDKKQLRAAVREVLVEQLEAVAVERVVSWLGLALQKNVNEAANARRLVEAVGTLTERPGYEKLGDDLLALVNGPKVEEPPVTEASAEPEYTEEDEAKSKEFLAEERRKILEGK